MHASAWITLLRKIPPEQHDNLSLVTSIGTEISVQALVRMEEDYLAIRGRLAGSTDAGRIFFVPYDQINYLGFQKVLREQAFRVIFGEDPPKEAAAAPAVEEVAAKEPEPAAEPATEESPAAPEPTAAEPEVKPVPLPGKAALLERLRARARPSSRAPSGA